MMADDGSRWCVPCPSGGGQKRAAQHISTQHQAFLPKHMAIDSARHRVVQMDSLSLRMHSCMHARPSNNAIDDASSTIMQLGSPITISFDWPAGL